MTLLDPTLTQKLIWLDQLITDSPSKYNIGGYALFEGMLDPSALEAALKAVLRSQEIYSAIFQQKNNVLQYYIKDAAQAFSLTIVDLSERVNGDHLALQWMEEDFSVPFILEDNYLFRLALIKVSECRYYCYAKLHHLISDGWSFKLLLDQMAAGYVAVTSGVQPDFPQYSYTDYALEDAAYYLSDESAADRQFWLSAYRTLPAQLFRKKKQGNVPAHTGNAITLPVSAEVKQMLQEIAGTSRASVFQVLVSLLLIYLGRTRRREEISLALPVL
ncbi:MAG TPA: condensation domain-containing protein, partial [Chitinophaga sp.]|nr:condensation domain-containing protein [Chitinophaga sp.]